MSKTGGFASSPQRCAGCQPEPSSGLSDWRRKRVKSVQFDHESIRLRTFAFSTFCSHAAQLMVWTATRTDPTGKWAGDPLQPWFQSLQSKGGLYCCARADGHPLDDGEWDIKDNKYRVFIQGEWIVVPDEAVISGPNKFGKAIVWLLDYADLASGEIQTITRIRCFIPDREFDRVT